MTDPRVPMAFLASIALTRAGNAAGPSSPARPPLEHAGAQPASLLSALGYPRISVQIGLDGLTAPQTVEAGYALVTLAATSVNTIATVDIVQPPPGLEHEAEIAAMLDAGRNDLVHPGWFFAGGAITPEPGERASLIVRLDPGDYKIAASYSAVSENAEETMLLVPLRVTAPRRTDALPEPAATVVLEAGDDLRFTVAPDVVPAGPAIWKIANVGVRCAHHVVMVAVPDEVTAEGIVAEFTALVRGEPPSGPSLMSRFVGVGYAALQSAGQTTWMEFNLQPGRHAVISYIMEAGTMRPHLLDGMVTTFTVR